MGILSDFKDNIVVSKMSKKPQLNIEELAKLSESQIKKILKKKEISLVEVNVGKISSYELAKKLVELYKMSKKDYDDIMLFFFSSKNHEMFKIFETSKDISNIKSILSEESIKRFISDPSYTIDINFFSEEFIKNNNDIFLVDVLPEEVRKRYYDKNITEKDLLENITVFRNMKHSDIIFESVRYNDENSKKIISKLGLDGLTKVINSLGIRFYNFYNDPEKMKSMCNFLNNKNTTDFSTQVINYNYNYTEDFSTQVINYIYTDKELLSDLSISDNSYSISSSLIYLNYFNINKIDFMNYFNKTFSHIENYISFGNFVSSFSKVLKKQQNFRSIDELFEEAAILTTKMIYTKEERYTKDFIEKHQQYFLPSDAPAELKEKYYNKLLTYKDIKENLRYFSKTNISVAFFEIEASDGRKGLFDNDCFLKILELCDGDLSKINFNKQCIFFQEYLFRCGTELNYISSYNEFLSLAEKYYMEHGILIRELESLKMLGINKKYLEEIENNIKRFGIQKDNIYFDIRLLSDDVIKRFNFDVIKAAATYYRSGAIPLLIEYSKDEQLAKKLNDWFTLLNNNDKNMLNERNINYIIISFKECLPLIDELLNYNIALSEKQMKNLTDIIVNKNMYNVRTIDELTNYVGHRKKVLNDKFESNNISYVQDAIVESLFSLTYLSFIDRYSLNNEKLYKKYILPNIPVDIAAAIEIIKTIENTFDRNKLKEIFNDTISLGNIGINIAEIKSALIKAYTQLYNNELFKEKENKTYYIEGTNSLECPKNVNGEDISSSNKIKVVELNGEPFKLIVHAIHGKATDRTLEDPSIKMFKNPSLWNTKEGATTLSTSLISNTCIKLFGGSDSLNTIYFGFNEIPSDVLMGTLPSDAVTAHGGGLLDAYTAANETFTPKRLINLTSNKWSPHNEVVLMRRSQENNLKFNGRIQPTCIVTFDNTIDEKTKLAAQYFNVPIYKINSVRYADINTHNKEMYLSGKIEKFDNSDIEAILSTQFEDEKVDRRKLCIELCKKAFSERLINEQQYYERLQYIVDYFEENELITSNDRTYMSLNYIEEINTILSSRDGVNKSETTR